MEVDKKNLVETLASLIKIPSFRDSLEISRWIKNEMEGFGYSVDSDGDGNLIAEIGEGPGLLLNAHMDTVAPGEGWKHDPFGGAIEDDKVYGRGASDCKAGLSAMIEIARLLKGEEEKLKKRIVFTFTAFEEGYPLEKNGVYRIIPKLKSIEKGLVLEPTTRGKVINIGVGCNGAMKYDLEIFGKRGHSARAPHTDNPIYRLSALLDATTKIPKSEITVGSPKRKVKDSTMVTEVCAREGYNVVPGKCEVTIDRRSLPGEKPEDFFKKLKLICKKSLKCKFRLTQEFGHQGYLFDDSEFMKLCKEAAKSAGLSPMEYFERGRIDGTILHNSAGIGTFMMGPGDIDLAHSKDEYCEIEDLFRATKAVLEVIRRWYKA